jgi:hypothetical protein
MVGKPFVAKGRLCMPIGSSRVTPQNCGEENSSMNQVWLEEVREELRRVWGLDLSSYRRAALERRSRRRGRSLSPGHSADPSADSVFGSFDLTCRNVLIDFSLDLQHRVLEKLTAALNPGGFLVMGMSESLAPALESRLIAINRPLRIFQKLG